MNHYSFSTDKTLHLVINLEQAVERREHIVRQAEELGFPVQFVQAIAGKDLDCNSLPAYDRKRRMREYSCHLLPNEQGCIQSHLKAIRTFLETDYEYCVINEDDVLFDPDFLGMLEEILTRTSGWECIKLWTDGRHYDVLPHHPEMKIQMTFPKKFPWEATSILYTRAGAEKVLEGFKRYWMVYDAQWAGVCFAGNIVACGVLPAPARPDPALCVKSNIDADKKRTKSYELRRNFIQWVIHRCCVLNFSTQKKKMRRKLARVLSVK
ncbi:glycosyltransferase family 25 protein [Akkermansia sp. N21169]|uniref:glycosyltransferase family 25 protein n=1 Tax=Akkermansia sp. N21169 TaxID=3040765 RepID=UPI00244F0125|nr:glycosyltransferase family 25 protein [Akkermansia sp. N21169]MDH3069087.1 glycosyltransferase family 25 protein [Akkermansia sp. N21169]